MALRTALALLVVLCCEPALPVLENAFGASPGTTGQPAYAARKKATAKKTKKKRKRKKRSRARSLPKPFLKDVTNDSTLAPGVKYAKMITGGGKYSLHVITVDYDEIDDDVRLEVLKGRELFNGLEKIVDIAARRDSTGPDSVLGAVNANFWKAYHNTPINPTVINGEVLEMEQYKQWSSAFFDDEGRVYIDRFVLSGTVRTKKGREFPVTSVNTRHSENGLVLYNTYSGDTIPYVRPVSIDELSKEALENFTLAEYDSTESAPALDDLLKAANEKKREGQTEYSMRKARVRYLGTPRVNQRLRCVVMDLDTGTVVVPAGGAVLSYGVDIPVSELPRQGDTLTLLFRTNVHDKTPFEFAVGGTPRLVRNGKAAHEAQIEGSTARRFISGNLSRTALGVSKDNSMVYLVAVDGTHRANGTRGMTLAELAEVLRDLGAYNAMNLDGGGSVSMVVGNENVVRIGGGEFNRKISVALGVVKKNARKLASRVPDTTKRSVVTGEKAPGRAPARVQQDTVGANTDRSPATVGEQPQPEKPLREQVRREEARRQEEARKRQMRAQQELERQRLDQEQRRRQTPQR